MAGFDFGQIGGIIGDYMDSDEIDIYRVIKIELPDGSISVSDPNVPLYTGIKCHLDPNETPNPDPVTAGTMPIIVSLKINCAISVDLQNADLVKARKLDTGGAVLAEYEGTIGVPIVIQSRQEAIMVARQAV